MKMKITGARVVAFVLIGVFLLLINGVWGNPISKIIVSIAAKNYVEQIYPDLNLSIGKVGYNFKNGAYSVQANSETSIDTYFSIEFTGTGKLYRDNYEEEVTSKSNTWWRVGQDTKTIWDTKNFMDQKDIPFYSIDVTLRTPYMGEEISEESSMEVREFLYQDIREDGLVERVQQNIDAIRVYYEEMDKEKI